MCAASPARGATLSRRKGSSALRSPNMASPIAGFPRSGAGAGHCPIRRTSHGSTPRFAATPTISAARSFPRALDELLELSGRLHTALMCAEAVWWRCHRALIADVLCVRGIEVVHILDAKHTVVHPYTSAARICSRPAELCTGGRRGVTRRQRHFAQDVGYRRLRLRLDNVKLVAPASCTEAPGDAALRRERPGTATVFGK